MNNSLETFIPDSNDLNLKKKAITGSMETIAARGIIFLLNLVSIYLLSRILSPDDYGIVSIVSSFVAIFLSIQEAGVSDVVVRLPVLTIEQFSKAFYYNVSLSSILAIFVACLAPIFSLIYGDERILNVSYSFSAIVFISSLPIVHLSLLRRKLKMVVVARIQVISFFISIVVGYITALAGLGYWSLVLMSAVRYLATTIQVVVKCPILPVALKQCLSAAGIVKDGSLFSASSLFASIGRNADNLLLGFYNSASDLGQYTRAYSILMLPLIQFVSPIGNVAIPILSKLQGDPEKYKRAYCMITTRMLMITTPLIAVLIALSHPITILLLGPGWEKVPVLFSWLGLACIIQPFTISLSWLMISQGRSYEHFRNMAWNTFVLIFIFLLSARHGVEMLAIAYGLSGIFIRSPVISCLVLRSGPVNLTDSIGVVVPGVLCAILIFIFTKYCNNVLFVDLNTVMAIIMSVSLSILFGFALYIIHPFTRKIIVETACLVKTIRV